MKEQRTTGMICVTDKLGIEFRMCRIDYIVKDDGHYLYTFRPDYSVIDMLSPPLFQGIPGLNLDLRKEEYAREDMEPVFITERTPGKNRADLWELLQSVGMDHLNRLEWLIRTDLQYFGDSMYAIRYEEPTVVDMRDANLTFRVMSLRILKEICAGNDVILSNITIDRSNRTFAYHLLMDILKKNDSKIKEMRSEGELPSLGRRRKEINQKDLEFVKLNMDMGIMTSDVAAKKLGIGRATLFRRLKEMER